MQYEPDETWLKTNECSLSFFFLLLTCSCQQCINIRGHVISEATTHTRCMKCKHTSQHQENIINIKNKYWKYISCIIDRHDNKNCHLKNPSADVFKLKRNDLRNEEAALMTPTSSQ